MQSDLQCKTMAKFMDLQFKIMYNHGKENVVADALSRVVFAMNLTTITGVQPMWVQEVLNSYVTDPHAQVMLRKLVVHTADEEGIFSVGSDQKRTIDLDCGEFIFAQKSLYLFFMCQH